MSAALLDVNVLIALFQIGHPHHEAAHRWFATHRSLGWATCPITINGCIRILSHPAYRTVPAAPADVASRLRNSCAALDHRFWEDSVSLTDETLFRTAAIKGHAAITDAYLLGLAVRNNGRLATFDRSISLQPVIGAEAANLVVIDG